MDDAPPLDGWLGPGARWTGALDGPRVVRIDGVVEGDVRGEGLVEVSVSGVVLGDVTAPQVLLAGRIDGALRATERATLLPTAILRGSVDTPWLDVRCGARLEARVRVDRPDPDGPSTRPGAPSQTPG